MLADLTTSEMPIANPINGTDLNGVSKACQKVVKKSKSYIEAGHGQETTARRPRQNLPLLSRRI
jgi:hypothetical protein